MNENKFYDPNNTEFNINNEKFELVQENIKITDKKMESKPTTFAKDAFKRFCKNKSSVVGAIIIGVLLLFSFLLPLVIPYDISKPSPAQSLLPPRLFNPGTGWWDGTKTYTNKPVVGFELVEGTDELMPIPSEFEPSAIISWYDLQTDGYTNVYKEAATGGYIQLEAKTSSKGGVSYIKNYNKFDANLEYDYSLVYEIGNPAELSQSVIGVIPGENIQPSTYNIVLYYNNDNNSIVLKENCNEYGKFKVNLNEVFTEKGLTGTVKNISVRVEVPRASDVRNYVLIKTVEFTCSNEEINADLWDLSLTNANANMPLGKNDDGTYPINYWQTANAFKNLYGASLQTVSFVYDEYLAKLGVKRNFTLGKSEMEAYIANGWCEYDFNVGPSSFKVLNEEKCPVLEDSVTTQDYNAELDATTMTCDVVYYKYLGFDSMPRYMFGTTQDGREIIKVAFTALRTSLLLAVVVSAINMTIGIVWGSISGYFGGTVDLVMERFCEILSGVPFMVIMTLALLLMGSNIVTFAIALCLSGWIGIAGRTRTQFYRFKGREYVLASRTLGASDNRLIFKHILPNALGTIVTSVVLMVPSVIFSEATLAYLNLGIKGVESFGVLLAKNQEFLKSFPVLILFPSAIISLLMISFNLFGNGLRDALNPSLKGSE